jgi:hypothetical protein
MNARYFNANGAENQSSDANFAEILTLFVNKRKSERLQPASRWGIKRKNGTKKRPPTLAARGTARVRRGGDRE